MGHTEVVGINVNDLIEAVIPDEVTSEFVF
jgi:hypothetical protein